MTLDPEAIDRLLAEQIRQDLASGESVKIGCSPVGDPHHVPSIEAPCSVCGQPVWLSRRIAEVCERAGYNVTIECVPCTIAQRAARQ